MNCKFRGLKQHFFGQKSPISAKKNESEIKPVNFGAEVIILCLKEADLGGQSCDSFPEPPFWGWKPPFWGWELPTSCKNTPILTQVLLSENKPITFFSSKIHVLGIKALILDEKCYFAQQRC